jgi:hypothetical protein
LRLKDFLFSHHPDFRGGVKPMARNLRSSATLLSTVFAASLVAQPARSDDAPRKPGTPAERGSSKSKNEAPKELPSLNLLEGLRSGQLEVQAEGTGDGRMAISVTNRTRKALKVVLPPGLVASGASGQFGGMGGFGGGGMGGMGGGMGGMGGMGGGMMGGMGGGMMGGMGGGMMGGMGGGMGGGMMGGMGGGMGGMGGMSARTLPATMGMMMLGRLIMQLCGEKDSWDVTSLMSGMMGGMGGGMMGGMGGGMMGGMGGGMGGMGAGGGFRSIPPTGLPHATLRPNQTRELPTRLVSLVGPTPSGQVALPAKGEKLVLGDIEQLTSDSRVRAALLRIAEDKAPPTVAQLALWHLVNGLDWDVIGRLSQKWANGHELSLARDFVLRLPAISREKYGTVESGALYWELNNQRSRGDALSSDLRKLLDGRSLVGLTARSGIPAKPSAPSVAIRIRLDADVAQVQVTCSDANAQAWVSAGKFELSLKDDKSQALEPVAVADRLAESLLARLTDVKLLDGPKVKGKATYKIRIDNASPLILNGLALAGIDSHDARPSSIAGFCLPPHRSLTLPATPEMVERLGLKGGVKLIAADLSAL